MSSQDLGCIDGSGCNYNRNRLTCTALLCMALAMPLVRGKVKRNMFYGARFRESFQSDTPWLAINRYAGQRMLVWSLPMLALGIATFFLSLAENPPAALILGFAPLVFVLAPVVESWRFARRRVSTK